MTAEYMSESQAKGLGHKASRSLLSSQRVRTKGWLEVCATRRSEGKDRGELIYVGTGSSTRGGSSVMRGRGRGHRSRAVTSTSVS